MLSSDLRYAVRSLRRDPGFTAVIVLTLALGIGANSAIFNLLDQVLLRALPVERPEELVMLDGPGPFRGRVENDQTFSYPMYRDFRDGNDVFAGVIARYGTRVAFSDGSPPDTIRAELVSGNYFDVLGVGPTLGRLISPSDDERAGEHPVVVLSHGFWLRRFGGDPDVRSRTVRINEHPMTVIGVAPTHFRSIAVTEAPDVYVPVAMKAQMTPTFDGLEDKTYKWLAVMARLRPGMTREQAEAGMNVLYRQLNERDVQEYAGVSDRFRQGFVEKHLALLPGATGRSDARQLFSTPLVMLMAMVGLVLLIACINAASLLVAKATARQREIAVRLSLGATRRQLVRQLVTESLLLATAGGLLGLIVSTWTSALLLEMLPLEGARQTLRADPDLRVLLFTAAVSALTGLVFGLLPAAQATSPALTAALKDERSAGGSPSHLRFRKSLVVAQVALSLVLLVGAGLFARSLINLRTLDPGFNVENVLTVQVDPSLVGQSREQTIALFDRLRDELSSLPGVAAAGFAEIPVMTRSRALATVQVDGYTPTEGENMNPWLNIVTPGYFEALDMPIVRGRAFTSLDVDGGARVAVINETMAQYFFKDGDPIGRRFGLGRDTPTSIEIVGVVRDGKFESMRQEPARFFYLPHSQAPELGGMALYLRSSLGPDQLAPLVREAVARVDPKLPLFGLRTFESVVGESLFVDRMISALSAAFGLLATLLAAVGLYGVMSYSVARRTREIGVRLALGAERPRVLWMVLKEVLVVAVIGVAVGLPASLGLGRYVTSLLFGLSPSDPPTLVVATLVIGLVAMAAGFVPARRAATLDPVVALRHD
jgi:predicted permease